MLVGREYCRSPVAQGFFESVARREGLAGEIEVDSAGTHGFYHTGGPPDPREQESVLARGIDISDQRARGGEPEDCGRLAFILTMEERNYRTVAEPCGSGAEARPSVDHAPGPEGFRRALDPIEWWSEGLIRGIQSRRSDGLG